LTEEERVKTAREIRKKIEFDEKTKKEMIDLFEKNSEMG